MTLNIPVLEAVATWLEAGAPEKDMRGMKFDMIVLATGVEKTPTGWCGTTCCIAGAAVALFNPEVILAKSDLGGNSYFWDEARDLVGLSKVQAKQLFAPWENELPEEVEDAGTTNLWPDRASDIDTAWAARTIRNFIKTGKVRWDLTSQ